MKQAWIFIIKKGYQRAELYGSLVQLYNDEKKTLEVLNKSNISKFRRLVKKRYVDQFFHIEQKEVKRSKHTK